MNAPKKVLVLDFDEDVLIALQQALEDSGFNTTATWSVDEALTLIRSGDFDFLILGNHPLALDAKAILTEARSWGLNFGSFVLGSRDDGRDGHRQVIDLIRSFAGYTEPPKKTAHSGRSAGI